MLNSRPPPPNDLNPLSPAPLPTTRRASYCYTLTFWHQGRSWASRFLNLETCNKGENSGIEVVNDDGKSFTT